MLRLVRFEQLFDPWQCVQNYFTNLFMSKVLDQINTY